MPFVPLLFGRGLSRIVLEQTSSHNSSYSLEAASCYGKGLILKSWQGGLRSAGGHHYSSCQDGILLMTEQHARGGNMSESSSTTKNESSIVVVASIGFGLKGALLPWLNRRSRNPSYGKDRLLAPSSFVRDEKGSG
jgi:hypothetical protein